MVLLISAGAGLLLLLYIAALLVDMRALLRKIELGATNLDHDWRILKEMNDRAECAIDEQTGRLTPKK